jgi:hypothetical protein
MLNSPTMKPLDIINCVDYGYHLTWGERSYLIRLAAVPLLVKLVCLIAVQVLGWQHEYLRIALVMLPSYFTEGWMLAHVCRLIFLDQRWPFRPSGNRAVDEALLADRAYGVMAGTLFYVVIKFLLAGFVGIITVSQYVAQGDLDVAQAQGNMDGTGPALLLALLCIFLTLWGFRLAFLYIPAAAGIGTQIITRSPKSFLLSVQIMGIWLICFLPYALIAFYMSSALLANDPAGTAVQILATLVQVFMDTLISITTTAALAWGIRGMMTDRARP